MASYKNLVGDNIKRVFAKNLQAKMREYDLTQTELGRRLGINATTVSEWCRGTVLPRSNRLEQLCTVLHCEPADLLGSVQDAVDEDLNRRLNDLGVDPKSVVDINQRMRDSFRSISRAMSELDQASLDRLAAYAEGLMAASSDKEKTS